jgi:pyruvate/2-oxoglutarate dehydrogenase complex dihydrolipoamide acyltransferase (E2) component
LAEVRIPQLGEGLREVRIVSFERRVGDKVAKGEVLYSVETDKSVVELESPLDGVLSEWSVAEGDIVPIGGLVAVLANGAGGDPLPAAAAVAVPPRTRAYAREKGLTDAEVAAVAAADGRKLYPADIDAFLGAGGRAPKGYRDRPLSPAQKVLNYRFRRSADLVIATSLSVEIDGAAFQQRGDGEGPGWQSNIQQFAHAVAAVAVAHPAMRSVLIGEDALREHEHVNIGVAVARPNGDLVTAAVKAAETLSPEDFIRAYRHSMRAAVAKGDQADEDIHVVLTTLDEYGIEDAVPTLVAPANSAIFLGARNRFGAHKVVMVFDHRVMNGVAAAEFLAALRKRFEPSA